MISQRGLPVMGSNIEKRAKNREGRFQSPVMPVSDFLKLDFGKKPRRKIYQRGDGPLFWDTYLHPECVEVDPPGAQDLTAGLHNLED